MARQELSPSEAARVLGTTTRTVQRWIVAGTLPARRVGGRWRVAFDALDAFQAPSVPVRPIGHLFIANRGEIARRIRRTCDRLGIRVTVPGTDGPLALDLLDVEAVVDAARLAGTDAVHPGFGFLAENAAFADAVIEAGLRWVGPPPAAIRSMGDKAAARKLATTLGIPVVPGYEGDDQSDAVLARAAPRIGYPLVVKPAAGGGGKGMRVVTGAAALADALASARREADVAFGDSRLILERFIAGPRHIEVQVLFDAAGNGIHLGERDCSIQRRHQKILEETPSPGLDEAARDAFTSAALRLAAAVGYESAGTCEFLVTDTGEWFFLEMNTRLQVEHPVTEAVTGRDLVADQLRIAARQPLGVSQADVDAARRAGGHAVEVRLYAEDAEAGFLPATGRVELLRWPALDGVRIDAGIDEGDLITGRFDPMLAKVIAHGRDRAEALERLTAALDATVLLGLTTNLRFLRWLVREPTVLAGEARIDTLERIWPPADLGARIGVPDEAWQAAARGLAGALAGAGAGAGADGWRLNAGRRLRLVADGGVERTVVIDGVEQGAMPTASVAPMTAASAAPSTAASAAPSTAASATVPAVIVEGVAHVHVDGRSVAFRIAPPPDVDRAARAAASHGAVGPVEVLAPMPGGVLAVYVEIGSVVEVGDPIVTLEAMKMEHVVVGPIAGRVTELRVRRADQVTRGQVVAVVEPRAAGEVQPAGQARPVPSELRPAPA